MSKITERKGDNYGTVCMYQSGQAEVRVVQGGGSARNPALRSQLPVGKVFVSDRRQLRAGAVLASGASHAWSTTSYLARDEMRIQASKANNREGNNG
jgi:hypothetical protein